MRTIDEVIAEMPLDQQAEIQEQARLLINEELTQRALRKARAQTLSKISQTLNISQAGVSRIERQTDLLLSIMRSSVEEMGGSLRIEAEFPDRDPVSITTLGSISQSDKLPRANRPRR
jgi:transcriptional regulator with XRE-family HTH domain